MAPKTLFAALIAGAILAPAAHAEPAPQDRSKPGCPHSFRPTHQCSGQITGSSDRQLSARSKSAAHHHAKSAFIMAYVISGAIRSQLEGEPARVYHAGETWSEAPGAHHTISENASATEPAELLAVFLLDTGDGPLTTDDTANNEPPRER